MMVWKMLKLRLKVIIRFFLDLKSGSIFKFAKKREGEWLFEHEISAVQEIKRNETYDSKVHNFRIAANKINEIVVLPGEIFSFWWIIGNPVGQFSKGRTIQAGKIVEDVGGGLCQVSGIIYYIALVSGLEVLERYNHTMDIYTDETRFCPLGTDATVVYGFKDLRIRNSKSYALKFELMVEPEYLTIILRSEGEINSGKLIFEQKDTLKEVQVIVRNERGEALNRSSYMRLD